MNINPLTERRKADRIKMAEIVRALATDLGAEVIDQEALSPHEISLEIHHAGGAYLSLDFDGKSCQPDVYVSCWNMRLDSPACFADSFGDINQYHYRKCTVVERGFNALLHRLTRDLKKLNSGEAYSAERSETFAKEYAHRFEKVS